jgi:putative transposase
MLRTGYQWLLLAKDFLPFPTVQGYFEIVKRIAAGRFEVLPRRWVVERTLAWLNRNRRLAKDFEATLASATTWIYIDSGGLLVRGLSCT